MKNIFLLAACVVLAACISYRDDVRTARPPYPPYRQANPLPPIIVFEGARLITGDGGAPIENSAFVVEGATFTRVGRRGEVPVPAGAQRVNLAGKTVIPDRVDLHGHIGYQHDSDGT